MNTTRADADLAAKLDRIEHKVDALLLAVQALQSSRAPLRRVDRARLERILPVCGATFGSELVTSRDVLASRAPGLRLVCKGLSTKQLGRLFLRGEGVPIAGFTVKRDSVEGHVILWRVLAC